MVEESLVVGMDKPLYLFQYLMESLITFMVELKTGILMLIQHQLMVM